MNGAIRIILVAAVLVLATIALLFVFDLISQQTLLDSVKYLGLTIGVLLISTVAIQLLSSRNSPDDKTDESHIR